MSQVMDLVFWFLFCFEVIQRGFAIQFVKQKGAEAPSFFPVRAAEDGGVVLTASWGGRPRAASDTETYVPSGGPTPRDVAGLPTSSQYLLILNPPTLYFL